MAEYTFLADAVSTFFGNVGFTTPDAILFLIVLVSFIMGYQDHKIGLISLFMLSITAVVFFYLNGVETIKAIALMFLSLIAMAFSLYYSRQKEGIF